MRTFEKTHPWLKFELDLRKAPPRLWINLGECKSKCEHIALVPLRPAVADLLHTTYLAKGVLGTTAIEGNTLTEEEVRAHIEGKLQLPPSREYLAREIDNILHAFNGIIDVINRGERVVLTAERIEQLNRQVLEGLHVEEGVRPGEIRRHEVGVARYKGAPAEDCPYLLERLCQWLESDDFDAGGDEELKTIYAIIKSIVAHLYFAWIHPFGDGNGRTARLLESIILLNAGVPAPAAHLLSNHYNLTRSEYYRRLDQAGNSGGDVIPFIQYAVQGFLDGLRSQLTVTWRQQWDVIWRSYVHERFRESHGRSSLRQRHLVLELSAQTAPIPISELPKMSRQVNEEYLGKTNKTLARDVNKLVEMGLVEKTSQGVRARTETILAFLPVQTDFQTLIDRVFI